jgi:2-oxoglutarate dehydrogenase E1 component
MNSADPTLLYGGNATFVEALYEDYLADPTSVEPEWRAYFDKLRGSANGSETAHSAVQAAFAELVKKGANVRVASAPGMGSPGTYGSSRLINAFRLMGHLEAKTNPLSLRPQERVPELEPSYYGLSDADLAQQVSDGAFTGTLREVLAAVQETYCGAIGFEFAHLPRVEREWLQGRIEANRGRGRYDAETKKRILAKLTAAEGLEKYLHVKYVGAKRFSLEGGDSTIPMLDQLIQSAGQKGVKEIMVGMAHRGRLNVLVNTFGKKSQNLFDEFEGKQEQLSGLSGDVKYHIGFSSDVETPGGSVHLALAFNPSHLELVDPVVEGSVRARQDRRGDAKRDTVLPILIHGDAAVVGQGIVPETLNLSQLRGYATGGTVHLVINNQVGFTISEPKDARSGRYTTDIAKFIDAPVFHVNGDDPEACVFAMLLALEYRMAFHKDAFVDLVCYRRHGHNEGDEPRVTQPAMYRQIDKHPGVRALYAKALEQQQLLAEGEAQTLADAYRDQLDAGAAVADAKATDPDAPSSRKWEPFFGQTWTAPGDTGVSVDRLKALGEKLTAIPETVKLHGRVEAIVKARKAMTEGKQPLDWGMAENLAYASLLTDGYSFRLTGQDVGRGTFFHRHAVFHNQLAERDEEGAEYLTLKHLAPDQGRVDIYDSALSEEAVLGFEYGYAATEPNTLVIWEAQFGDFANTAQAVIDQYISSGEVKWRRLSGVVMMLPHGYEGQGPEHSSARLERYLQLCAEENMQVCVPSTPAQIFHLLRRQMVRPYRKPLVIITPKSLLRHKLAVSSLEELAGGRYQAVIGDAEVSRGAERVILCAGKLYYELIEARAKHNLQNLAIVRVEQLYPFAADEVRAELAKHPGAHVVWAQEEPKNQGAWYFIQEELRGCLVAGQTLTVSARPASASPATGYPAKHVEQQQAVINRAVGLHPAVEEPALLNPTFTG